MSISICPKCKALVKNGIHECKKAVPAANVVSEEPKQAVKEKAVEDKKTIPPKEVQPSGNKPIPQSAVPQDSRFVRVLSANLLDAGSLASNIVLDGKEERLALIFDREFFISRYVKNRNPLRQPVGQEDFKAIVFNHGGPVPSRIKSVETKPDQTGNWVCVMWRMK